MRLQGRDWLMLGLLAAVWGGSFPLAHRAVAEMTPLVLVLGRVGVAALALNLVLIASGRRLPLDRHVRGRFLALALLNNLVPFTLIFWSQTLIDAGPAAILNATTPLWAVLLGPLLAPDVSWSGRRLAGVLVGVAGVAVLIGPDALTPSAGDGPPTWLAELACIGAALSYALAGYAARPLRDMPALTVATGQLTMSSAVMLPAVLILSPPWSAPPPGAGAVLALAMLALACTAFAYVLFFAILARAGAINASLVTLLVPPFAILISALLLDERPTPGNLVGMMIILAGLIVLDGRPLAWLARFGRRARQLSGGPARPAASAPSRRLRPRG